MSQLTKIETPSKQNHTVSFEDLPEQVLVYIFDLLGIEEILKMSNLSVVCRYFANTRLYKKIKVVESLNSQRPLWWPTAVPEPEPEPDPNPNPNHISYTYITDEKLPILISTLERNPKLVELIKIVHILTVSTEKVLVKFIDLLRLTELYDEYLKLYILPNDQYLRKYAYSLNNGFHVSKLFYRCLRKNNCFQNLVELKLE